MRMKIYNHNKTLALYMYSYLNKIKCQLRIPSYLEKNNILIGICLKYKNSKKTNSKDQGDKLLIN